MMPHHEHFDSLEQQRHAARFGMWIFLASEVLLFSALVTLFAAYRAHYPQGFEEAVHHNTKVLGSINTGVLLVSSAFAASAVHAAREERRGGAALRILVTIALGAAFLVIKFTEYGEHIDEGLLPGGRGSFFAEHATPGLAPFWTLYWVLTGIHALHVTIGMGVLASMVYPLLRGRATGPFSHRLELAVTYWHLVDIVWIFLWPLLYLA